MLVAADRQWSERAGVQRLQRERLRNVQTHWRGRGGAVMTHAEKPTEAQLLAACTALVKQSTDQALEILRELVRLRSFNEPRFDEWAHNLNRLVIALAGVMDVQHAITLMAPQDEHGGHHFYVLGGDGETDDDLSHKLWLGMSVMNNRAECACIGCGRTVNVKQMPGMIVECYECAAARSGKGN